MLWVGWLFRNWIFIQFNFGRSNRTEVSNRIEYKMTRWHWPRSYVTFLWPWHWFITAMGRFSCCWCLFILLVLVVIVTNTGNAKKNSEQKRQKKEQIKSSDGTENTARNKQQNGKKKGETKPSEKKTEGRKKVKKNKNTRKKKLRVKDEGGGDYSTSFDPNWACNRNQVRNYCFGSGFAGHDVSNMSEADFVRVEISQFHAGLFFW